MITGKTRLFFILAHPVAHVRTPMVFNDWFAARGVDAVLVPMEVPPDRLAAALDGLRAMDNVAGGVVTMPHKPAMVTLLDEVTTTGRRIGACNTVRRDPGGRLVGTMLDGDGFVAGLRAQGHEPRGRRAYLAGAGGAASAIAFGLAEAGVTRLTIHNRTRAKAEALAAGVRAAFPATETAVGDADPGGHDLVVNGSSLGMKPDDPLPLDAGRLDRGAVVAEAIMAPETTPLLAAAAARGCPVHHGRHMLDEQIILMARFMGAIGS